MGPDQPWDERRNRLVMRLSEGPRHREAKLLDCYAIMLTANWI